VNENQKQRLAGRLGDGLDLLAFLIAENPLDHELSERLALLRSGKNFAGLLGDTNAAGCDEQSQTEHQVSCHESISRG
jgi:hypothetical protein